MNSNRLLSKIFSVHQPFLTVSWVIWTEATHQPIISHELGSIRFYADWSLSGAGELGGAQRKAGEKSLSQATSEGDRSKWNWWWRRRSSKRRKLMIAIIYWATTICQLLYEVYCHFPCFTDEQTKVQRGKVTCPILHSYWLLELFQTHDYPSQGSRLQKWDSIPDQIRLDKM